MFGDPHFVTFDGVTYSFNGKGEYSLVVSEARRLVIQGRTAPVSLPDGKAAQHTEPVTRNCEPVARNQ